MTVSEMCQRWRERRPSWQLTSAGGFDPTRYRVVPITEATAATFIRRHHYAGTYPAARFRYGLLDRAPRAEVPEAIGLDRHAAWLVGVAVYGVPMSAGALTRPFPTLHPYTESIELSRLVLLDEVPGNAESWFVDRTFASLAGHGIRGVIAFSDPVPRRGIDGRRMMPGHVGWVYQALGAACLGRATRRSLVMLPDGTSLPARARAKVTARERGHRAVVDRLHTVAATLGTDLPAFTTDTDPTRWLTATLTALDARTITHPGNWRYAFRIDTNPRRRHAVPLGLRVAPYPKLPDAAMAGSPGRVRDDPTLPGVDVPICL